MRRYVDASALTKARERAGLSVRKAARLIGCAHPSLLDLEQGAIRCPSFALLAKLATFYRAPIVLRVSPDGAVRFSLRPHTEAA